MLKLLLISDSLPNKISYYLIMLLLAALPFDQFYSHAIFGCFAVHTLIHFKKDKLTRQLVLIILLVHAIFYISLIDFFYTGYYANATTDVTRQLIIFFAPIFFGLNALDLHRYKYNFLNLFTGWITIVIIYLYIHAFMVLRFFHRPLKDLLSSGYISHNFSAPIQMHATFFSLQVAIAFFYAISQLVTNALPAKRAWNGVLALLLFAGLVQLGSKAVLAAVLLGVIVLVPYALTGAGRRLRYVLITGCVMISLTIGGVSIPGLRARFLTDLQKDLSAESSGAVTDARLPRWKAAMQVIARSPVIGYGTGSELNTLGDEFYKQKLYNAYLGRLNAHNQYLSFLITSGIVGLLIYLATLFWGFKIALAQKDMMMLAFLLLIVTVSFSESLLNAEKGVFFYSLFFSFFIFSQRYQSATV